MIETSRVRMALCAAATMGLLAVGGMAAPALAQAPGFGFGDGFDNYDRDDNRFLPERILCLTDSQVRQAVADRGYTHISLNVPNDKRVQVRATKGGTVYLLKFNLCTARIEDRDALRPAQ